MNKYYAWASNEQGAVLDIVLPISESRRSKRALKDAARRQLSSGWQVHIMCIPVGYDGFVGEPREIERFTIR